MRTNPFITIRLKTVLLASLNLPDIDYPIPTSALEEILSVNGNIDPAMLLLWLQECPPDDSDQSTVYDKARIKLTHHMAPQDDRERIWIHGDEWELWIGPVNYDAPLMGIYQGQQLLALFEELEDGKFQLACYHSLTAGAINRILEYSVRLPYNERNPKANKWLLAQKHAGSTANVYAEHGGSVHLGYWPNGLGVGFDQEIIQVYHDYRSRPTHRPAEVATQIGVFYEYAEHVSLGYVPPPEAWTD